MSEIKSPNPGLNWGHLVYRTSALPLSYPGTISLENLTLLIIYFKISQKQRAHKNLTSYRYELRTALYSTASPGL